MSHSRILALIVGLGLLALSGGVSGPERAAATSSDEQEPDGLAHALKFRQTFGFPSSEELVARVAADPSYSSEDYGVPLSGAERAEMLRRIDVERAAQPAVDYALAQPDWTGYRIDQLAGGEPVFFFAGQIDAHFKPIAALMGPTTFRVERVERTLTELLELQKRIDADTEELVGGGIALTMTAINVRANRVTVGVDGLTDEVRDRLVEAYGDALTLRDQAPASADACSGAGGRLDCRPMKGGLRITNSIGGNVCTSGFIVRRANNGGRLSVLTAGHCIAGHAINTAWNHNGSRFGDSKYHTWGPEKGADVGLIEIDNNATDLPTSANKMWLYNSTHGGN